MQTPVKTANPQSQVSHTSIQPLLLLAVLGIALFFSATWTERADASGLSTWVVYATRFTTFATFMTMAWFFRNHIPPVDQLLAIGALFMALHLLGAILLNIIGISTPSLGAISVAAIQYASAIFEGVANALVTLLYAHVFSSFSPRKSAIGLAIAYLVNDIFILLLDLLDTTQLHITQLAFVTASLLILAGCVRQMLGVGSEAVDKSSSGNPHATTPPSASDHHLQYGMARAGGEDEHPLAFLTHSTDWLLLLVVALLFPSLFGLIAQVSSVTGGNFALYDVTTEIAMIVLQALFLIYMAFFGGRFGFATILVFVIPLYATGFALFPGNWESGNPFAGCLIRGGYVVLTVLIWSLMARKSYEDPRHTYLYFSIYCGISNAQLGRLMGSIVIGHGGPSAQLCTSISLVALWTICIFGLATLFLSRRGETSRTGQEFAIVTSTWQHPIKSVTPMSVSNTASDTNIATNAPDASSAANAATHTSGAMPLSDTQTLTSPVVDTFALRLDAFSSRVQLTPREQEVLIETVHGYSRTNIAKKLALSPETIKTYQNRIYNKASVSSKQELIALIERESIRQHLQ